MLRVFACSLALFLGGGDGVQTLPSKYFKKSVFYSHQKKTILFKTGLLAKMSKD